MECALKIANKSKIPLYATFLDREKAYDRVERTFLYHVMERGHLMPAQFVNCIKNIYKDARTSFFINGTKLTSVSLRRGLRQGDGLSCPLYLFVINAFMLWVMHDPNINFWKCGADHQPKVSGFADDCVAFLADCRSIGALFVSSSVCSDK